MKRFKKVYSRSCFDLAYLARLWRGSEGTNARCSGRRELVGLAWLNVNRITRVVLFESLKFVVIYLILLDLGV
jgi:hypothetical protein